MITINGTYQPADNLIYYHVVIFADGRLTYFRQFGCSANVSAFLRDNKLSGGVKKMLFLGSIPIKETAIPKKYIKLFPEADMKILTGKICHDTICQLVMS